jgi:hypothetical protein
MNGLEPGTPARKKLLACLNDDSPTPERLLYERLQRGPNPMTEEGARATISVALIDNVIRWVAFSGYVRGGRP